MTSYVRYLASTDATAIGAVALHYLRAILKLGVAVRVVSVSGGAPGIGWEHYTQLLATPVSGGFVNVVCCDPSRWVWTQRVPMPTKKSDGSLLLSGDVAEGVQELRTSGVCNVLLTNSDILTSEQLRSAERYDAIVCNHSSIFLWWGALTPGKVDLIPTPVSDDDLPILRQALLT